MISNKVYEYNAQIVSTDKGGAYAIFPYDIRKEFGKGRVKVHATFDGEPYDGSIVNMGVKNLDGSICYIIGVRKDIREKIGKQAADTIAVTIQERVCVHEVRKNNKNHPKKVEFILFIVYTISGGNAYASKY